MMFPQRIVIIVLVLLASPMGIVLGDVPGDARVLDLFDGKPRTLVVNGYSTSFQWPGMLQRKLDKYFDGRRVIEVKSATHGGTPIARWMNLETGQPRDPWLQKLRPLLKDKPAPTIVLGQQSLQWVFGDRTEGIRDAQDTEAIETGAAAIREYSRLLLDDGADAVVIAMHIYKHTMEPAIGNERLALAKFMESSPTRVFAGPDVWGPTSKVWPQAFRADKVHPNEMGAEIMAHHWFKRLLELGGYEVPSWSEEEMKQAMANPPAPSADGNERRGPGGRQIIARILGYDKNRDGQVTKEEFKASGAPAWRMRIFERMDRDGDGVISKKELSSDN